MLIFVALVVLLLVAFPATAPGRVLRRLLVEAPARRLNGLTAGRVAFYGALALAGVGLFWLFEAEGIRLFSFIAPDLLVWFTMFDVSVFLDVFILAAVLAARVRIRAVATALARGLRRMPSRVRTRARGRERADRARISRGGKPSEDPEPGSPAFALA
jgi:hypothetical protein